MTKQFVPLWSRFLEALAGAASLHADQPGKGTPVPYVARLLGVASIALQHGADVDEAMGAFLHDKTARRVRGTPQEL